MKFSHVLVSLLSFVLMVGIAKAVPSMDLEQRSTPPPQAQGRGSSGKPPQTTPTPAKPTPATQPKGPQTAGQHLAQQPQLAAKLKPLLPPGADVQAAALGFKSLGEFVSTVHVSHNLNIPFDQLKTRVTGPDSLSLGKAIKELRPSADAAAEVKKAQAQARKDQAGGL